MELQAARCPSCSGEMQLNPKKETGFCMHCGSKILVKEAIQKIRIDSEHLIKNYLEIAMAAFERGDYSEAYDYYTKILEIDPAHSWEIHHYRGLSAGYLSDKNRLCLKDAVYGTEKALAMVVAETKDLNKLNKYRLQLTEDLYMFYNKIHELPAGTSGTPQERGAWCSLWNDNALVGLECIDYCLAVLDQTGLENDPKHDDLKVRLLKLAKGYNAGLQFNNKELFLQNRNKYLTAIEKYDPDYVKSEESFLNKPCYVATAVYGDANAPQVILLRQYRDQVLVNTVAGRMFVKIYYRVSPTIAIWLNDNRINAFIRNRLDILIKTIRKRHML